MKVRFFNPGLSYQKHKAEFDSEIQRVLSAGDLILRDDVEKFEENLAEFVGTKYAVGLNSGTDALVLALKAAGVGSRHWTINAPSYTFKSTIGAIKTVHPDTSVELYDLGELPSDSDVAIVAHIAGEIFALPQVNYCLIEDSAQALGAVKNPTSFAQTWSFYPAKILGAFGDAGALTTNDSKVYEYVKDARNHFKGSNEGFGVNSRLDNLQAAILNIKLKYLPEVLARRKEIADMYLEGLKGIVGLPNNQEGRVWQDFIIRIGDRMSELGCVCDHLGSDGKIQGCSCTKRNQLYLFLKKNGIETMKNEYPFPIPKLPLSLKYEAETLRIPCNENLTNDEVQCVVEKIKEFFAAHDTG